MGHVPLNSYWAKRDVSHLLDVSHFCPIYSQQFRYLDGVQGGAFADVVGDDPHGDAVLDGLVLPDPADEDLVLALAVDRHRVGPGVRIVYYYDARRLRKDRPRLFGGYMLLGLYINALRMGIEDRDPDTGRAHSDRVIPHYLPRLMDHLHLFFGVGVLQEDVYLGYEVKGYLVRKFYWCKLLLCEKGLRLVFQFEYFLLARARNGLEGGDDYPLYPRRLMQGPERDHHLY